MEPCCGNKWSFRLLILVLVAILEGHTSRCCLEQEKAALLQLKSFFMSQPDSSGASVLLSSWNGTDGARDCCLWDRVTCSNGSLVHHVTGLSFKNLDDVSERHIDLFQELVSLDLSFNNIRRLVGKKGLAHLKKLQVLDLSANLLNGPLSSQGLCELRNLQELRLEENELSGNVPKCLWNLTSLRVLDLSGNRLGGSLPTLVNLPSLRLLNLEDNGFQRRFSLGDLMNHSRQLQYFLASNNALQIGLEESLCSSTFKLKSLGLRNCNVNGEYETFPRSLYCQSSLEYIDVSSNGLVGSFPVWLLQNNSKLAILNLKNNLLEGSLMLPKHRNLSLYSLDISGNKFTGKIPEEIGMALSSLRVLNMSFNAFEGRIPASVGNMTRLAMLDLSDCLLVGEVPRRLFSDSMGLDWLFLSNNNLQGEIFPSNMSVTSLLVLYLDGNNFVGTIRNSLRISTRLLDLDISDNNVGGELPRSMGDLTLISMSLARNHFHGAITNQLCMLESLVFLDLSENKLIGEIPSCVGSLPIRFLHLHGNHLSGAIPKALAQLSSLVTLDVGNNRLSGGIPHWIDKLSNLLILLLGGNLLEGELPIELCRLQKANIIDLSNNNISGVIPSCFRNLSFGEKVFFDFSDVSRGWALNVDNWSPDIDIYTGGGGMTIVMGRQEDVEFIAKSKYSSYKGGILSIMSELDLSCNKLTGSIPHELGELRILNAMNLSHNRLSGSIPESFSKLKSIESLDLSNNNFSGTIPSQLVDLTFLEVFMVSYNNFSGRVPETGQFGTFDESSYIGNPFLCGSQLPRKCDMNDKPPISSNSSAYEQDEGFDMQVFLWSFGMSAVTILVSFGIVLGINPYWRRAWFAFIDVKFLWWFNP